jgi:hypothetical protein
MLAEIFMVRLETHRVLALSDSGGDAVDLSVPNWT